MYTIICILLLSILLSLSRHLYISCILLLLPGTLGWLGECVCFGFSYLLYGLCFIDTLGHLVINLIWFRCILHHSIYLSVILSLYILSMYVSHFEHSLIIFHTIKHIIYVVAYIILYIHITAEYYYELSWVLYILKQLLYASRTQSSFFPPAVVNCFSHSICFIIFLLHSCLYHVILYLLIPTYDSPHPWDCIY